MATPVHRPEQAGTALFVHVGEDRWAGRCEHCLEVIVAQGTGGLRSALAVHTTTEHGEGS